MVNPIRFGGIASGLDTESLVKQLVSAEKTRVDKFTQQKIWKQWQQTAYNETNKTMANFILDTRKNLGLTRTTSTGALVSGSINTVDWVKKASSSNDTAFEVKATAERKGRNPKTGEEITIAAKNGVKFKVGKKLQDKVNA